MIHAGFMNHAGQDAEGLSRAGTALARNGTGTRRPINDLGGS
ncbi:MAG: hypothetical protein ACI89E_001924 [Planctomycetota bacterium]|jgi:hypothetical protein